MRTRPSLRCSSIASPGTSSPETTAAELWKVCVASGSVCVSVDYTLQGVVEGDEGVRVLGAADAPYLRS
jgi:hypothetical protein